MLAKNRQNTLFCFSPPVMIATFIIEISLALYVMLRFHRNEITRLIVATLLMLGLFQLAEYFVCGGASLSAGQWSRVGYVAITALPALGLHMMFALNKSSANKMVMTAYASMAGFMAYFLLSPTAFAGHQCTGNYVIFQLGALPSLFYGLYYYGWLLAALLVGARFLYTMPPSAKTERKTTKALMVGYAVFLVPTAMVYAINPQARAGIPSIMCGFAVLFALILALYILPEIGNKKPLSLAAHDTPKEN
ncbi:hypothetical protein KC871_04250 [Candidatus Saccharibacteria bacterium]|nr:hypothetical protein [Candidatus Saccharibacteria bacterium]MCB9817016.1 hypothetical protein [Candidatus Nomurabacteria bacterium]